MYWTGAVLAQKFRGGIAPITPSSPSPFSPFSEIEKFEIYRLWGCQLCNVLDPETRRNEIRRAESGRGGVLGRGHRAAPHQLGSLGRCKLPQRGLGRSPRNFGFWSILGPQKSRQNGQLAFVSERRQQVNLAEEGTCPSPCLNVEPPLILLDAPLCRDVRYASVCFARLDAFFVY